MPTPAHNNLTAAIRQELSDLLARGNVLGAVRRYRQLTGTDLATAKAAIDRLADEAECAPTVPTIEVWFPHHRRSFFGIPVGLRLPPGPLCLRNVEGDEIHTTIEALSGFGMAPAAAAKRIGKIWATPVPPPPPPHTFEGKVVSRRDEDRIALRLMEVFARYVSESQLSTLRDVYDNSDLLLMADFGVQFIDDNQRNLPPEAFKLISEGRVALGGYPLGACYRE